MFSLICYSSDYLVNDVKDPFVNCIIQLCKFPFQFFIFVIMLLVTIEQDEYVQEEELQDDQDSPNGDHVGEPPLWVDVERTSVDLEPVLVAQALVCLLPAVRAPVADETRLLVEIHALSIVAKADVGVLGELEDHVLVEKLELKSS